MEFIFDGWKVRAPAFSFAANHTIPQGKAVMNPDTGKE
jgi:hypothetical protein